MRFKRFLPFSLFTLTCTALVILGGLQACGKKEKYNKKMADFLSDRAGCLNDFGVRVSEFVHGEITTPEWEANFDCAIDALDLFKSYVRGSVENGYSQEDLRVFASEFLLTESELTPELMDAGLKLKAALIGGTKDILTVDEIDSTMEILRILKKESVALIPHMKNRVRQPTPENLMALSDAIGTFSNSVADQLSSETHADYELRALQDFANELSKVFHFSVPSDASVWIGATKAVVIGGSDATIEAPYWDRALRMLGSLGGPAVAALSYSGNKADLFRLTENVHDALNLSLSWHDGALPLTHIDRLIDTLPAEWLPVKKDILKQTLRPLFNKLFAGSSPDAIDRATLNIIFESLSRWNQRQTHLEKIFQLGKLDRGGVNPQEFVTAAKNYSRALGEIEKIQVNELITIATKYRALFVGEDGQMTISDWDRVSLTHLSKLNWIRIAAERLIVAYGNLLENGRVSVESFRRLIADFEKLLASVKGVDPTVPSYDLKRFREINLFTFESNGDQYVDLDEAVYYVAIVLSTGKLTKKIEHLADTSCPILGTDAVGGNLYDGLCFRQLYFDHWREWWDHFPELTTLYETLDETKREELRHGVEAAARAYGYSNEPVGTADVQGFAAVPHYVETLFNRLDKNNNQELDLSEVMMGFDLFKNMLAEAASINPTDTGMLEAIYTYIMNYGYPPQKTILGGAHFLQWKLRKPWWKDHVHTTRLDLYKIIGLLNDPNTGAPSAKQVSQMQSEVDSQP